MMVDVWIRFELVVKIDVWMFCGFFGMLLFLVDNESVE